MNGTAVAVDGLWEAYRKRTKFGWRRRGEVQWALRDVSLGLKPGHVLGVVGGNGSGKTTLLQVVAGVLRPSRGQVTVVGRVASLVDLSAGFHRDLTGHENLMIGGVLLGLGRKEIRRRYDAIAEFSGLPVAELVARLGEWRPHVLGAYASMLGVLADEQRAGRLEVAPRRVVSGSEVLTAGARRRLVEAWGPVVFDQYATTEGGIVASECAAHAGMHALDHVVLESVDGAGQPVADGTFGAKLLLTVLSSRTLPLIRYELSDSVCLTADPCPCGRPSPRVMAIGGRARELVHLPGAGAPVVVHPVVFTRVMDGAPVGRWQVVVDADRLRVLVTGAAPDLAT
ncbi:hypothetical protein BH24ACT3_BH24ACT3_09090 [soil metagenome]